MKRKEINIFNIAFLDLLSGALGAVIILYVAVPKHKAEIEKITEPTEARLHPSEVEALKLPLIEKIEELEASLEQTQQEKETLEQQVAALQKVEEEVTPTEEVTTSSGEGEGRYSSGFEFRGKNLVFIIDVSGSMVLEDRMGQVRAGLKMFLRSLTEDYRVDIVFFPDGTRGQYRSLWGGLMRMDERNKREAFDFLDALFPYGATPTRQVLRYTLGHYRDMTDIILLSDGAPTQPNSSTMDSPRELLEEIQKLNQGRVQINTIGVGSDMVARKRSLKYDFLNDLSEQNEGFFHPF